MDTCSCLNEAQLTMDFVTILPPEVTEEIFSYLSIDDLEYCNEVSQLWKTVINDSRQGRRIALKNNWERGIFKKHYLEHVTRTYTSWHGLLFYDDCMKCMNMSVKVKVYPAKDSLDCFYYPLFFMKEYPEENYSFYMICIDANLKMSRELLFITSELDYYFRACVLRDYVVWFYEDEVQRFDAKCELDNRVKTIGTMKTSQNLPDLNPNRNKYERFLAMDSNHIVAATCETVKVWCKQTHELILECCAPPNSSYLCSFCDGCLVISTASSTTNNTSQIKIYNMRNQVDNFILQHEINLDGKVKELKSNKNSIIYTYEDPARHIVVVDKKSYAVKFSHSLYKHLLLHEVFDELIVLQSSYTTYVLNFITCEFYRSEKDRLRFSTVFSNLAVGCYDIKCYNSSNYEYPYSKTVVWNWKQNVKLFTLTGNDSSEKLEIVSVSELMVVCVEIETGNFIIYTFE